MDRMEADRILETWMSCGLTEYESKVYFTLLLTERLKMGEPSRKSSVPQPKIYLTVESLVDVVDEFPKTISPTKFEPHLGRKISEKQREISNPIESGNAIRDTIYGLRPVAVKYRNKHCVFEPKHRRRRMN